MKKREVEHVRYRSSKDHMGEVDVQAVTQSIRMEARLALKQEKGALRDLESLWETPGSASATPADFVRQAHTRSLQVTTVNAG